MKIRILKFSKRKLSSDQNCHNLVHFIWGVIGGKAGLKILQKYSNVAKYGRCFLIKYYMTMTDGDTIVGHTEHDCLELHNPC